MREPSAPQPSWVNRMGWLVLLWIAGVSVVAVVALLWREVMRTAGLKA
jgi:hypothetical protein